MTTPHRARSASALWRRAPFPAQVLPDEVLTPRPRGRICIECNGFINSCHLAKL